MKLQDRVAIVTGAAQGIGKAVADKLAAEGASVVAVDLNGEGAERTAAGFDGSAVQADISKPDDVQRIVDEALSRHGKVDVLANVTSNVILAGTPNLAHYVASKGGVWAFTRAAARELGKYGITVNSVAPGLTETEGVMASPHAEAFEFVQMLQCIPRRGEAADIAPSVAFLASEEAGWVTGQLLVADAGMSHS